MNRRSTVAKRALRGDRGSAAVEFALLLPVILVLVCGLIDFGRLFFAQITVTDAAREGVRVLALEGASGSGYSTDEANADATTRAEGAAGGVSGTVTVTPGTCTQGEPVSLTVSVPFDFITPLPDLAGFIGIDTVTGTGVMRCGG